MTGFWAFVLGLVFGSFLNALVWRLPRKEKMVWASSHCPHCSHKLAFWDLVPLASFLWLGGKCRYCSQKISYQYPLVELAAGLGLLAIVNLSGSWLIKMWLAGIFLLWLLIFVYDLKYLLIPDVFTAIGLVWVFGGVLVFSRGEFLAHLGAGLAAFIFFFSLYFFSKGVWLGGGDAKLGFLIGFWLGWPMTSLAVLVAYMAGAIVALALLGFRKATLKSQVPFGPFLVSASLVAYFWGEKIINWYLGLF